MTEANAYPRRRRPLVPSELAPFFEVPLSFDAEPSMYLWLADLDASVWAILDDEAIHALAESCLQRFAELLSAMPLELGRMRLRQFGCTPRVDLSALDVGTVGRIGCPDGDGILPSADAMTLAELTALGLSAEQILGLLAELSVAGHGLDSGMRVQAELLGRLRVVDDAVSQGLGYSDVRFGPVLHGLQGAIPEGMHYLRLLPLADCIEGLCRSIHLVAKDDEAAEPIARLAQAVEGGRGMSLRAELKSIMSAAVSSPRDADMTIIRMGWGGDEPLTLEEVAQLYGMTRERVRQIVKRSLRALQPPGAAARAWAPVTARAVQAVGEIAPCSARSVSDHLVQMGIDGGGFSLRGLVTAASSLGVPTDFELAEMRRERVAIRRGASVQAIEKVIKSARAACRHGACADVRALEAEGCLADTVLPPGGIELALSLDPDFEWIDRGAGWFWFTDVGGSKCRFLNVARKALVVAGELSVPQLRSAMRKNSRMAAYLPPEPIFAEVIARMRDEFLVNGDMVSLSDEDLKPEDVFAEAELAIWNALVSRGGVANVRELESECLARGIARMTFWVRLRESPAFRRRARCIYGLVSAEPDRSAVVGLLSGSGVCDKGTAPDGRYWSVYRLSHDMLEQGRVPWPTPKGVGSESSYSLQDCHGMSCGQLVGTGVGPNLRAGGLDPVLRRFGAEVGDWMVLVIDPVLALADIHVGPPDSVLGFLDDVGIEAGI